MNNVVTDQELALLAVGRLRGDVGVDFGGDANRILLGESRPAETRDPEGRENNPV
jgi:hypothetical protein